MVSGPRGLEPRSGYVVHYLERMSELSRPDIPDFDLVALEPLLDSANMAPRDWIRVAQAVVERAARYDGFVVLHGTDTMVYTASALSYLLQRQSKPVVFTGSQLPLEDPRSDARMHIITAAIIAGTTGIPEVCLFFGDRLLRGNRSQKVSGDEFMAFESGNLPPLARVGVNIELNRHLMLKAGEGAMTMASLEREPSVVAVRLFPGMTAAMFRAICAEPTEGIVLETYGAGTFPVADRELLSAVREAVDRGVVIVNTSQCHSGSVLQGRYATSRPLGDVGVVSGHDMTPEAALTKLYCLLGAGFDADAARMRMEEDLAGEITVGRP